MKNKVMLILVGLMLMVSAVACKHGMSPQQNTAPGNSAGAAAQVEGR